MRALGLDTASAALAFRTDSMQAVLPSLAASQTITPPASRTAAARSSAPARRRSPSRSAPSADPVFGSLTALEVRELSTAHLALLARGGLFGAV